MALEGSLTDFGLADILQLIYFQRKTGVLTLEGRMDKVRLFFIDGNISGAESRRRIDDNRLGKVLAKKGLIKETDLQAALEEQRKTGTRLGNILIIKELVSRETIADILNSQITETVIQLFSWKQGTYEFTAQGVPQDKDMPFSIDTQHLLMEGLRIVDESSAIRDRINLDTVFVRKAAPVDLTEEEQEIFGFVDGENDVSTIIDLAAKDNFQVSKTLLALMEKGIIEAVIAAPVVPETEISKARRPFPLLAAVPSLAVVIALMLSLSVMVFSRGDVFRGFSAAGDIEDLRFRIETYRLEHGAYPRDMEPVSRKTDPWGRPYIYRAMENSFVLLSAGPDGREDTADDIY